MKTRVLVGGLCSTLLFAACGEDGGVSGDPLDAGAPDAPSDAAEPGRDGGPGDAAPDRDAADDAATAALEDGELAPGGATTTDNVGVGAFTVQAANLPLARRGEFEAGLQFFQLPWVLAPGRADTDGLGPTFHADSCLGCHVRNGRGDLQTILLRIGLGADNAPDPNYGSQLQPFGISGVPREGTPVRTDVTVAHARANGTSAALLEPSYAITNLGYGPFGADLRISPRIAPQIVGQGLLEAISDADVIAGADPNDADGDGISGRVHWVDDGGAVRIGRFGWKAMHASVESQTAAAFAEDLGITSSRFPDANCPGAQSACRAAPNGGSPELNATRLRVTVAYMRLLGVPRRRGGDTTEVLQGKAIFTSVGCASCHRPSFRTRADAAEPELAGQLVWPYSDLLLHDLGERLADRRKEGDAGPREWRTPPLWGLGLVPVVNGARFLLHDGRARDLDEAILWHDGEAAASRIAYEQLSPTAQARLRAFVESL